MKKFVMIVVFFVTLFSAGCNNKQDVDNVKVLEFWTLQLGAYEEYLTGIIEAYEKEHPDIKIKWIDVPFKEGEKRALAAALSNKVPDLINLNPIFSSTLASKKALVDMNEYLSEEQKADYLPASWDSVSLGDFTFGIPWYITSSVTIYNKEDLQKSGIKTLPKTYTDLFEQSIRIKEALNKYAYLPAITEGDYFLKILVKNDVPIISNEQEPQATFNTSTTEMILKQFITLYANDYIPDDSIVANHALAVDKFQSGANTFIIIGPNFIKTIKNNAPQLYKNIDVTSQIVGSTGKVDFSIMNFVVPVKSKYKKEAVDFALFITNSENQLAFSKLTPTLPSNMTALNDEFFEKGDLHNLEEKGRIISARQLKEGAQAMPVLRNQQELLSILSFYIQKAVLQQLTAEEALKKTTEKWNNILK
jgi:putative chitobiose transport system substrate-binding protein